jgi:hypothetical protein
MFSVTWWRDATERAVKTAVQALLGVWVLGDQVFNVFDVDWKLAAGAAAGGALLSYATSLASLPLGRPDTASMLDG